jgi:hypothetical protein
MTARLADRLGALTLPLILIAAIAAAETLIYMIERIAQ